MVEDPNATVPSGKLPLQGISWGAIVCVQALLLVLGGMVLDDGFIGTVLLGGTVLSWICGIITALCRRSQSVPRVLAWSWLVGVILTATVWSAGGLGGLTRTAARRALIGSNERQIALACISYCAEDPKGSWPLDMPALIAWSKGGLDDRCLKVRWHPELEHPILYVRPVPKVSSRQPILISDPTCDGRGRSMVCYGDGHVEAIADAEKAKAVWAEAKRLAALPKAQAEGIAATDWAVGIEARSP
jgi:prepilin-type processing-associated H-X9-DG protein